MSDINAAPIPDEEVAMNAIVANVLMREAAKAQTDARPFKIIALFSASACSPHSVWLPSASISAPDFSESDSVAVVGCCSEGLV
jgi:hypothetical protein